MPPSAVKTIRDLIFWEYAKLISGSALGDRKNFGFVMSSFKKLQGGEMKWSEILREDLNMDPGACAYCGSKEDLSIDHIVPKRECHFAEFHNIVKACKKCNSSKSDTDLIQWWGLERRYEMPRIVMGKYLKMLYICHECRNTLESSDLNNDNEFNLLDLSAIFQNPCDPEKAKLKNKLKN
jgi:DNA-directed RNA polymerase subunit RPC12/RpoP